MNKLNSRKIASAAIFCGAATHAALLAHDAFERAATSNSGGQSPTPPSNPGYPTEWCLTIQALPNLAQLQQAKDLGFTRVRTDVPWDWFMQGGNNWGFLDNVQQQANAIGLKMLWILPPLYAGKAIQDRTSFVSDFAARNAGKDNYYEDINEPDQIMTVQQYAQILNADAPAIKSNDPACKLLSGGTSGYKANWYSAIKGIQAFSYVDGLGYHPYDSNDSTVAADIVDVSGFGKPCFVTEWGSQDQSGNGQVSRMRAAKGYTPFFCLFTLHDFVPGPGDGNFGLCDKAGNPKPAYQVVQSFLKA